MSKKIAIDGPAGAGKSTIAKIVAKELGFIYVDTGAMYRAMALYMINNNIDASDSEKISATCQSADITIRHEGGVQRVYLNGEDVSELVRKEEVGKMASASSVNGDVRKKLVELQQKLAQTTDVVMDGRDIGTVVLPDADLKVFLTASSRVRANRRYKELTAKGETCDIDAIEKDSFEMCQAERMHRLGVLPKRICHCDTKVDNLMFDRDGNVLCVIDLDTVMPNFVFSDIGDFLRSAANTGREDDPNLDNVSFNMDIFRAFTRGYIKSARSFLLPVELEHIPFAARLFPFMQTVRFLADYLNGDTYYKIQYKEHNLVRSNAQWKLYQSATQAEPEMRAFVTECLA